MGIKQDLDKLYNVTDEEIDKLIFEQLIEDEEKKVAILKELVKYNKFDDYVKDHEEEFNHVDITDDFQMIIFPEEKYADLNLDLIKKIGIVAEHYGIFIWIENKDKLREKLNINI